jgi:hypothetical protein
MKPVISSIAGETWMTTDTYNINDFPESCDIFTIGQFTFDRDDGTYVMKEDESNFKHLK